MGLGLGLGIRVRVRVGVRVRGGVEVSEPDHVVPLAERVRAHCTQRLLQLRSHLPPASRLRPPPLRTLEHRLVRGRLRVRGRGRVRGRARVRVRVGSVDRVSSQGQDKGQGKARVRVRAGASHRRLCDRHSQLLTHIVDAREGRLVRVRVRV